MSHEEALELASQLILAARYTTDGKVRDIALFGSFEEIKE
jgi:hypothetical protein